MTFKHIQFSDSPIMRSLEKVAHQKGLIKEDDQEKLVKNADVKFNFVPTKNLSENILKLCSGLRHKGFDKFADQLEEKFIIFKKAESELYDNGDDGDDFIYDVHPEGDVEVAPAKDDNGVVETIVDQHKKIVDVVQSKPTGKISDANQKIINQVKLITSQSNPWASNLQAHEYLEEAVKVGWNIIKSINEKTTAMPGFDESGVYNEIYGRYGSPFTTLINVKDTLNDSWKKIQAAKGEKESNYSKYLEVLKGVSGALLKSFDVLLDRLDSSSLVGLSIKKLKDINSKEYNFYVSEVGIAKKYINQSLDLINGNYSESGSKDNLISPQAFSKILNASYSKVKFFLDKYAKGLIDNNHQDLINETNQYLISVNELKDKFENSSQLISINDIPNWVKGNNFISNNSKDLGVSVENIKSLAVFNNLLSVLFPNYFSKTLELNSKAKSG